MAVDNFLVEIILVVVAIIIILFLVFYFWLGGKNLFETHLPSNNTLVSIVTPSIIQYRSKSKRSDTTSFFIYLIIALVVIIIGIVLYFYLFSSIKNNNPIYIANNITNQTYYPWKVRQELLVNLY